jgi:hypothetical protein
VLRPPRASTLRGVKAKPPTPAEIDAAVVELYMGQLADPDCPAHLKLGAAKALDAHRARQDERSRRARGVAPEEPGALPDPMDDLSDDLARVRARRATGAR